MLVLTRKVGEAIAVGDEIRITVVEVKGGHARIGIEAPADVRIYREEIYVKVKEQNRLAAAWDLSDFEKAASLFSNAHKEP